MEKSKIKIIIFIVVLLLFIISYPKADNIIENFFENKDYVRITRVIDGDTAVAGNQTIRLLGINTPEKGEKYYNEAKKYLEKRILNKTVRLIYGEDKKDLYKRTLAYIYFNGTNINKEIIEKGYGNIYFPSGKTEYYSEFFESWNNCIKKEIRLCESSEEVCGICVKLDKIDYKNQVIVLKNSCGVDCDLYGWSIKDEGRKNFMFDDFILDSGEKVSIIVKKGTSNKTHIFWEDYSYVMTNSGDSIFLRDSNGKLVDWKSY